MTIRIFGVAFDGSISNNGNLGSSGGRMRGPAYSVVLAVERKSIMQAHFKLPLRGLSGPTLLLQVLMIEKYSLLASGSLENRTLFVELVEKRSSAVKGFLDAMLSSPVSTPGGYCSVLFSIT